MALSAALGVCVQPEQRRRPGAFKERDRPDGGLSLGRAMQAGYAGGLSKALPAGSVDAISRRLLHLGPVELEALPEAQHRARNRPA